MKTRERPWPYFPMDRTSSDKRLGTREDFGRLNTRESILYCQESMSAS